jgi:cell division protein FtsI (penicillin-binding protein 3)
VIGNPGPTPRIWRAALLLAVFVCLFGLLGFRLHTLQVLQHDTLRSIGEKQRVRIMTRPANRGSIYDGSGAPIVVSQTGWTLAADPSFMDDRLRATIELARIVPGLDRAELRQQFECGKNGRTLAKGLSDDQATAVRLLKLAGLTLTRESLRAWPGGSIGSHVIGFVNNDGKGGGGIEQTLDARLSGTAGREVLQVDALGKPVLDASGETVPPIHGAHVQLTIEVAVQRELESALAEAGEKHAPKGAAGIVVRVATGEIVAMASWPTFDPLDRTTFKPDALNNRAVQLVYEPGSTFKPLIAGAAEAEGLTSFNETIFCEHGRWTHRVGKAVRTITDHSVGHGGHANLTVTEGIALSDNILMAKLGLRLGPEKLYDWVVRLHFGHKLGMCLPGEGAGIVNPKNKWNQLGACMSVPMGHEIAVTPIQLVMAHAAIANRGTWLSPRLVKRIWQEGEPGTGPKALPLPPESVGPGRVFEDGDAGQIEQAMTHTMTEGTGKKADLDGYIAAGKTGTTMKLVGGRYSDTEHVGSFVCWAPAQPGAAVADKLICLIAVDDATKNGHYGAEVAAPYVQKVLQFALEHARVPKVDKPEPVKKAKR